MLCRLRDERGNVTIAVILMFLMVGMGAATYSVVDTQTGQSRKERERESTFALAEGALNAQTYVLGRVGTGTVAKQFPASCPDATNLLCPDSPRLLRSYDGTSQVDFKSGNDTWSTTVRDNNIVNGVPSNFYNGSVDDNPRYDANGDRQLWVKSSATVRGHTREIVALVRVQIRNVAFPRYAITAGWFATSNNGRKTIVDTTGSLGVAVRCNRPPPSSGCLDYQPNKGQLQPPGAYVLNYANPTAISEDDLQALEDYAKASGTYYAGCPNSPTGAVVVVESGNCAYNDANSPPFNSAAKPGVFIIKSGTFFMNGNAEFYGLVYAANLQNSSGVVVETGGTSVIYGGVMIDGPGGMAAGSSGLNVEYRANIFDTVSAIGTAGVVQNTWREIVPDTK